MCEDGIDSLVEHRKGQSVKVRGRGDDHVATGEGLLTRQAPIRAEQLAGEDLEVNLREPVGGTRHLDRGAEIGRGMTSDVQLRLPSGQQVLDADFRLVVPGGPGCDRPRRVGSIGSDRGCDLCRAGRVQFADLGRDAGYRPSSEPSGRARIGDDPVPELDRLGGTSHTPHRCCRVEVVSQECRVGALPSSACVSHQHRIRDQDMIVHLGIASPGCRVPRGRPDEPAGGDPRLASSPPTTPFGDETVQIVERRVALGIDDLVHVLGAADHAEFGH